MTGQKSGSVSKWTVSGGRKPPSTPEAPSEEARWVVNAASRMSEMKEK